MHCLFNVSTPNKKVEWTAELDNAKLRLADFNNPGWYLQEENGMIGETAVLRRTLPLISAIVPLFLQESKYTVRQMIFICFILMRCAIWYHLHNLKNVRNTHGGLLLLEACNFTNSNTPPWLFFTFIK